MDNETLERSLRFLSQPKPYSPAIQKEAYEVGAAAIRAIVRLSAMRKLPMMGEYNKAIVAVQEIIEEEME